MKTYHKLCLLTFFLLTASCQCEKDYLKSYLQKIYPGSKIRILTTQSVDSTYSGFGKLIFLDYKIKDIKQRYIESVETILESSSLEHTWYDLLRKNLQDTNTELYTYFDAAKLELEQTLSKEASLHLRPNARILNATILIDSDTITNTYFVDKSGYKISHSMTDIFTQGQIIRDAMQEWSQLVRKTIKDLDYLD